jgi:hypothetical protein
VEIKIGGKKKILFFLRFEKISIAHSAGWKFWDREFWGENDYERRLVKNFAFTEHALVVTTAQILAIFWRFFCKKVTK